MIIKYNNNVSLKNALEELITLVVNFHNDISEKDLYNVILSEIEKAGCDTCDIQPEVNLYKGRTNFGWKHSTLRYLANSDEFSMFLPAPEPLSTPSGATDIQKTDKDEDLIHIEKVDLLRDLKQIDIQLSKLIKKIEGGEW